MQQTKNIKVLFWILLFALCLPFIQMHTHFIHIEKLKGWFKTYEKATFTIRSFYTGEFQEKYNTWYENNTGLRPILVRIHNQIKYSLYGEAQAVAVIKGKQNYLYELNYIKAYNGTDYLGYNRLSASVDSLHVINEHLKQKGIDLIVCLAAGKGSYYPEFFPDEYLNQESDSTNLKTYKKLLIRNNLYIIDFNSWFLSMKDTSQNPLYPQYGIHWSEYGSIIAADSLISYISNLQKTELASFDINNVKLSRKLKDADYDIAKSLNLIFQMPTFKMAYADINWQANKPKVKTIVIADSYYWLMHNKGVTTNAFDNGGFWFYHKQDLVSNKLIEKINYTAAIDSSEVIVLMATEATLPRFPFGFTKKYFEEFDLKME